MLPVEPRSLPSEPPDASVLSPSVNRRDMTTVLWRVIEGLVNVILLVLTFGRSRNRR
jgi:hypothetical protein